MTHPILVTSAIIINENQILLVHNKKHPEGMYSFPGGIGSFERVSHPDEAVKDEVLADTGCRFEGTFYTYHFREDNGVPMVTLFYLGKIEGTPTTAYSTNIAEVRYFRIEEARKMVLGYDHNEILERLIKENRQSH